MRTTPASVSRDLRDPEAGLGLIEIVVSIFLIGLLAIALLPLIVQGLKLTHSNTTLATATQLVNERMELARAQAAASGACSGLTALAAQPIPPTVDERGISLQPAMTVSCPSFYPGTATVTISVTSGGETVSTAETLIFVNAS